MTEVCLQKVKGGLFPLNEQDRIVTSQYKTGDVLRIDIRKVRNPKFHRKFFALLNLGFESWEPPEQEYKGLPAQKNFERFRKDVIVAAGYYDVVANLKGEVRAEAKSISFASMDETDFSQLYNAVANVLLQRVLSKYTREDLDQVVERMLMF